MSLTNKIWLVVASVALVGVVTTIILWAIFSPSKALPKEHLIPDVTYHGQYLGTILSNQEPNAVRIILDYWNDQRFDDNYLATLFEPTTVEGLLRLSIESVAQFFTEQGYVATVSPIASASDLKYYIANNIPVYVNQKLVSVSPINIASSRVYIGYSDIRQVFIVHDNNFGNNYEISYEEYERLSAQGQQMLIVHPLAYELKEDPSYESALGSSYPNRLGIMNDPGLREVQLLLMEVNLYKKEAKVDGVNRVSETIAALERIISHEAFDRLHPAARMSISYNLSGFYMEERPDIERAITILTTVTLPLIESYDFSQPFGEWDRKMDASVYEAPFWNATPWTRLGYLYIRNGNEEEARAAFEKALTYIPDYPEALDGFASLDNI